MSILGKLWIGPASSDSPEDRAVRIEQLLSISKLTPVYALASLVNSVLTVVVLWDFTQPLFALLWCATVSMLPALLLPSWWRNRTRARPVNIRPAVIARATRRMVALGLIWGAGLAWMFPSDALPQQMFLAAVAAGICAAGAAGYASIPRASIVFALALLLPTVGLILNEGTIMHLAVAAMAVMFAAFIIFFARMAHAGSRDAGHTRVANAGLEQDLEVLRNDLLDAVESISEGFAFFDENDRLRYYNKKYLTMFRSVGDMIIPGTSFTDITRAAPMPLQFEGRTPRQEDWLEWRLRHHREGAGDFQQQLASGRWNLTTDRRTRQGGYVTVHVDITDMKVREVELAAARDDAESANRSKSEFLALMSHELRTPLNAVLGFSDILTDESYGQHSDARYLEYSRHIHDSGSHLLRIINEILDLSTLEAGKFKIHDEDFELASPFDDVRRMMSGLARDAGLTMRLESDDGLPGLRGDLRTVRQILINLISNAIKFTPAGGSVTVTARRQSLATGGGLLIQITDTGVGIAEQDIPKVLAPFGQIEGPLHREHQGTGLGLPLVQSFMQLHGGEMSIDSALGEGTTISLQFPRERLIERAA
jgi:two-component system cell cycle sensor histidine kinase PleC